MVVLGENNESRIIVSRGKTHIGVLDIPLDSVQQIKYIEEEFHDLVVTHSDDHSKGHTMHRRISKSMQTSHVLFARHLLIVIQDA